MEGVDLSDHNMSPGNTLRTHNTDRDASGDAAFIPLRRTIADDPPVFPLLVAAGGG
jgi:hypothetical protein